jgi:hypothetical protein
MYFVDDDDGGEKIISLSNWYTLMVSGKVALGDGNAGDLIPYMCPVSV